MAFTLPDLPFDKTAFGDTMSAQTFDFHHGKHHKAYVDKTNDAVAADSALAGKALSEVIVAAKEGGKQGLFNNSAQVWNHTFFWHCLSPEQKGMPGELETRIKADFGSVEDFKSKFAAEAVGHFASGWAWLVLDGDKLAITSLHDADSPVAHGMKPLLTLDVWEHAYYLDYQNARPAYAAAVLDKAINWEFVAMNLDGQGIGRADQKG